MKSIYSISVLVLLVLSGCRHQNEELSCGFSCPKLQKRVSTDVAYLSDDSLEGREAGTEGARKAAKYIADQLKATKVDPVKSLDGYFQEFNFLSPVEVNDSSYLEIKGTRFELGNDFYPIKLSAKKGYAKNLELVDVNFGIENRTLRQRDYSSLRNEVEGKAFILDIGSPDGIHPHSDFIEYHNPEGRIKEAIERGAAAVLLVDRKGQAKKPQMNFKNLESLGVPVLYLKHSADSLLQYAAEVSFGFSIQEIEKTGKNVLGFLNNDREYTVVIGAHYDHLGYGHEGSLYRGEPQVHNGADDNASGVAGMLELARNLSKSKTHPYNYLFIAFSAEEKGLLGSNHFAKNPVYPLSKIAYMVNMDMIGRLDSNTLIINGVGSSPAFSVLDSVNCLNLNLILNESGIGPSDHTSFYLKDIPVLSFFTGAHDDYHKPTDDFEKVNVEGIEKVLTFIKQIDEAIGSRGSKPEFTKTKEKEERKAAAFKVTLGVVPDYGFQGKGMRIDGVTEGKVADKAGILAGDIVVKLGAYKVDDIYGYMEALSIYSAGDTSTVSVKRNGKIQTFKVRFND